MNTDAQMQAILDQYAKFAAPPLESVTPEIARNLPTLKNAVEEMTAESLMARSKNVVMPTLPEPVADIQHLLIPTLDDGEVLARVYIPEGQEPFPALVYFHGGGWVIANLDVYETTCRRLCNAASCIVISVAYRQAPEHKYPAAVNDAYYATQWIMQNASVLNVDSSKIAVGGESAGANLATVSCLKALDDNGLMPIAQLLIYPVTDSRMNSPSYTEQANANPLNSAMMAWFWNHYLDSPAQGLEPYASPLLALDVSALPPTIVITAELDPLRDEGEAYVQRLRDAGVPVSFARYDGLTHEFFGLAGAVTSAQEAVQKVADELKDIFSR